MLWDKIEENQKAGSQWKLNPRHLLSVASVLPPRYDNQTTWTINLPAFFQCEARILAFRVRKHSALVLSWQKEFSSRCQFLWHILSSSLIPRLLCHPCTRAWERVAAGCAFQYHLRSTYNEGPVVIAQWKSIPCTSQVSWAWLPVAAGLFTFLYFTS